MICRVWGCGGTELVNAGDEGSVSVVNMTANVQGGVKLCGEIRGDGSSHRSFFFWCQRLKGASLSLV